MKVAMLGLGRMGRALALRLIDGGHDLTVWNRSAGKAAEAVAAGATEASTPADAVGPAQVVMTSLSDDEAVRRLALGHDGIRPVVGTRVYVDTSTVSPALSDELGRVFERFVALPILGAPQAVRAGEATYLAGGRAEMLDQLGDLLASLSPKVKRYARPALAAHAKLAVNLLLLSGVATLAESFTVGRAGGLSDEELSDLLAGTPMLAPGLKTRFEGVQQGSGPRWWTTEMAAKDARLAIDAVEAADMRLRVAPGVRELYRAAARAGLAHEDMVAVARLYR